MPWGDMREVKSVWTPLGGVVNFILPFMGEDPSWESGQFYITFHGGGDVIFSGISQIYHPSHSCHAMINEMSLKLNT